MNNQLMPLCYAIIKHFENGNPDCAEGVIHALEPDYGSYKLLASRDVEETLATAKENGILDESDYELDDQGNLRVFYRLSDLGKEMIGKYIG